MTSRNHSPVPIRPLDVVIVCLVLMTVAGGLWLLSAAKPIAPVDGAVAWQEQSPLRAVVQLLCLNYGAATFYAGDVKNYILGLGAALALIAIGVAVLARARTSDEAVTGADVDALAGASGSGGMGTRRHISPLTAAQIMFAFYVLWALASSRWSLAPRLALGAGVLTAVPFLWAFAIGAGLTVRGAMAACRLVTATIGLTAVIAIWYHYGRNPTLRAGFPVGNPTFLGACLTPGVLLAIGCVFEAVPSADWIRSPRHIGIAVFGLVTAGLSAWAMYLADARGPYVGLAAGLLAMIFFAVRRRKRWVRAGVVAAAVIAAASYGVHATSPTASGSRSDTLRLRLYAWDYAWRMYTEHPVRGHGQGGFVLTGDAHAVDDVLSDPPVFQTRIAHAHSEWLEVLADLGSIGLVLIASAIVLTVNAGMSKLDAIADRNRRWALVALLSALVGLCVEECFGVGLRVAAVPMMFATVLGLIWALSASVSGRLIDHVSARRIARLPFGVLVSVVGLAVFVVFQSDFAAARAAFRVREALLDDDFDAAIRLSEQGTHRLNPQRVLTNLYRETDVYLRGAQFYQDRARDRELRANAAKPPNQRVLMLADEDYRLSDRLCDEGSGVLKRLVEQSPGFFNHGRLEYWLNVTRAGNADARNDPAKRDALLTNAQVAAERELRRQPFNPLIVVDYLDLAAARIDPLDAIEVLARPLRYVRIDAPYAKLLARLTSEATFDGAFRKVVRRARDAADAADRQAAKDDLLAAWAPELLRLGAASEFQRGFLSSARGLLERACPLYEPLANAAPMGAASCAAELADSRFYDDPLSPGAALKSARRAVSLAPNAYDGRQLIATVQNRMVDYLLAAGDEQSARDLLWGTAPPSAAEADLQRELAARYRRLTASLLQRQFVGPARHNTEPLLDKLLQWITRSLQLNPTSPEAHLTAADVAVHRSDCEVAARHVEQAVGLGLPPDGAVAFIRIAMRNRPNCPPLVELLNRLAPAGPSGEPSHDDVPVPSGDAALDGQRGQQVDRPDR